MNGRLYPTALAEMARVLRPGSGRAVLLVAQPHLLGLSCLKRERQKDRKAARKHRSGGGVQGRESQGAAKRPVGWEGHNGSDVRVHCVMGNERGSTSSGIQEPDGVTEGSNDFIRTPFDIPEPLPKAVSGRGSVSLDEIWDLRAQYPVNVGGLVCWLLVLNRTFEPAPPEPLDRRRRWVGVGGHGFSRGK